jgi:hypothetical protein
MSTELNPMGFKTSSTYLEYILNSNGEIMWMHFDEAQRIESAAKDEAHDEGFAAGFREALNAMQIRINEAIDTLNEINNEQ